MHAQLKQTHKDKTSAQAQQIEVLAKELKKELQLDLGGDSTVAELCCEPFFYVNNGSGTFTTPKSDAKRFEQVSSRGNLFVSGVCCHFFFSREENLVFGAFLFYLFLIVSFVLLSFSFSP